MQKQGNAVGKWWRRVECLTGAMCGPWPNTLKKTAEWAVGEGLEGRENKDELLQELLVSVYCTTVDVDFESFAS